MRRSGGPPNIGGTGENLTRPANLFGHLLTHAPTTVGGWTSSRVPPSATFAHLGPFGGGPSRVRFPATGVSPVQSFQLVAPLTGHAMPVQSNNVITRNLLQRNGVSASSAMLPRRNGVSESSDMLARGNHHFSFQWPQPHFAAPSNGINTEVSVQIHPNYYPNSILMNRPSVPRQPPCTCTSRSFSQFLAQPQQEMPIQFRMEHGVPSGPILVASNPLTTSSVLGASGSSRAQSVGLLNSVRSARRGALTQEAGNIFVQQREPIGRNDELMGFSGGLLHGHALLAGTESVQRTVPMGTNIGLYHGHMPLGGPRSVPRRQPTGLFASTTRGGDRATAVATNDPMAWRLARMIRTREAMTRARADILAAARGRGRQGGANRELSD
ncbi:hypothetical protein ACQJBY_044679 [Aegilops geniculata]